MHVWGDNWEYWDDMGVMVARCEELVGEKEAWRVKEKWGTLRWYVGAVDPKKYREIYEILVGEYPHLRVEILSASDYPEVLWGIVDPKECGHEAWHTNGERNWCGVCGKELADDEIVERHYEGDGKIPMWTIVTGKHSGFEKHNYH